jgi:hypothetical protein
VVQRRVQFTTECHVSAFLSAAAEQGAQESGGARGDGGDHRDEWLVTATPPSSFATSGAGAGAACGLLTTLQQHLGPCASGRAYAACGGSS